MHHSIRIGLVLGIASILLSCGFLSAVGQDSSPNPPYGYDRGAWVLTDKTPVIEEPNVSPERSVSGNSSTVRYNRTAHRNPEGDRPAYYLETATWTQLPIVLYPETRLETIMTVSIDGNGNPVSEPKPAPNSQKGTWDVPWGTTGKTITILMECLSIRGASVYYTYTYQEQKASSPACQPTDRRAENHLPSVTLSYFPIGPTDQEQIEFTAEASDPDGDELTYSWFVDDEEQPDTGSNMSTILTLGDYNVTVKVSDGKGGTDEDRVHFKVTPFSGIFGCVLEAVYLQPITDATVTVEDPDGNVILKIPVDENGIYFAFLPQGTYQIWASAPGYLLSKGMSEEHIEVMADKIPYWINIRLVMEPTNRGKPEISTKSFEFADWGAYRFAEISGKRYFAAYLEELTQKMPDAGNSIPYLWQKSKGRDLQINGQISEVLMDDKEERTLTSEPLKLKEGYELAIISIDIDGNEVYIELSKDDSIVDSKVISPSKEGATTADQTYYYKSNVGRTEKIVQIAVYFENIFRESGQNKAIIGGVFQISNTPRECVAPQTGTGSISDLSAAIDWINKGHVLDSQDKNDEAIQAYDEAIEIDPQYVGAWIDKGSDLHALGKYDDAIKAFDETIRLNPNHVFAWNYKGNALKALGRDIEANAAFARAKELGYNG